MATKTIIGITEQPIALPYVMAGWVDEGRTVYFRLLGTPEQVMDAADVFESTGRAEQYAAGGVKAVSRFKRDQETRIRLAGLSRSRSEWPVADPWGPGDEYVSYPEGEASKRFTIGAWLNRDFEGCALGFVGIDYQDFNAWLEAYFASELDLDVSRELRKPYNRFRREIEEADRWA